MVLKWFHDGKLKSITLQFVNIDCALYVGSVVLLLELLAGVSRALELDELVDNLWYTDGFG